MTQETRLRTLENQVNRIDSRLVRLRRTSYRYSWLRIGVVIAGIVAAILAFDLSGGLQTPAATLWLVGGCIVLSILLFGVAVYVHRHVEKTTTRFEILRRHTEGQIARSTLDWDKLPLGFHLRPRAEHPFEADLDLVGSRSIHKLVDTAVSFEGSQRLWDWLSAAVPDRLLATKRQALVRELVPRSLFRDKLIVHATEAAGAQRTWKVSPLSEWLEIQTTEDRLGRWLLVLTGLAGLNAVLFLASWLDMIPPLWQATFVLYLALTVYKSRSSDAASALATDLEGALRQLSEVFGQLETFSYAGAPGLKALCAPFLNPERRPSRYMTRLTRIVAAMGIRSNPWLRLIFNALVPLDVLLTYLLDRTKAAMAKHARDWMNAWFEVEALSSLANFGYLHPSYAFPMLSELEEEDPARVFDAEHLGHPLLAAGERVRNSFSVESLGQVAIITGSNMAGKSVFLKTVGANLALAYAGGPVCAHRLETVPFRLFYCMGISDSVTDGISYFYGEVKMLRALLTELERDHPLPLLFGIDEIFRGTNNRERLIGSRAYVRSLAGKSGVGLIATHDLELAKLADESPAVTNYHFRDQIDDGRMVFDYRLRPGPCPTTNALTIMELEGLPVPSEAG
jgi:hypothetical protein